MIARLSFMQNIFLIWFLGAFGPGLSILADPTILEHPRYLACAGITTFGLSLMLAIGRWLGTLDPRPGRARAREIEPTVERRTTGEGVRVGGVAAPDFGRERRDRHAA